MGALAVPAVPMHFPLGRNEKETGFASTLLLIL
jgi:hypothetical protein